MNDENENLHSQHFPNPPEVLAVWKTLEGTQEEKLYKLSDKFPSAYRMHLFHCILMEKNDEDLEVDSALGRRHSMWHPVKTLDSLKADLYELRKIYFMDVTCPDFIKNSQLLRQGAIQHIIASIYDFLENSEVPAQDLVPLQHLKYALDDLVRGRECHFFDRPKYRSGRKKKSTLHQSVFVLASVMISLSMESATEQHSAEYVARVMEICDLPFPTPQLIKSKSRADKVREPWQRLLDWRDGLLQGKHGVSALKMYERRMDEYKRLGQFAVDMALIDLMAQAGMAEHAALRAKEKYEREFGPWPHNEKST